MKTVALTALETKVLKAFIASSASNGHDFGFVEDGRNAVDNPDQLGAITSSLVKKGLIEVYPAVRTESGRWTQFILLREEDKT